MKLCGCVMLTSWAPKQGLYAEMIGLVVLYVLALLWCSVLFDVPDLIHVVGWCIFETPKLASWRKDRKDFASVVFPFWVSLLHETSEQSMPNSHKHVINSLPGWSKTLFCAMPKRIRRQRPECGIPVESGNDRRLLKKGFPEQFFLVGDSGTFFLLCLVANCLHGLSWHFPSLWVARLLTPSCAVGWFQAQPQKSPWKPEMVRRLGSGNIGNHDLSKPPNNPTTDLAKPHRSFSFWDFPALLQLHVGTRGMGPEFFLRGPFKQPNLKPQTLEILGFEKGPKCHGSCISLLLLHLEQSQAQHGVVFAQVFGFPGCQAQPCASGSQDLNDTRSHRGSMGY